MKIILNLLVVLILSACSSPRYSYYFKEAEPVAAELPRASGTVLHLEKEALVADLQTTQIAAPVNPENTPILSRAPGEESSRASGPLAKADKKKVREELKALIREIKKDNRSHASNPAAIEARTTNPRNNGFAIAGFVCSIVGMLVLWPLVIPGVILSAIGLNSERRGLAIAGLIIGIVGIILVMLAAQMTTA